MTVEAYYEENMILTAFGPDGIWRVYHQQGDVGLEYFAVTMTVDGTTGEIYRTGAAGHMDYLDAVVRVGVDIARQVELLEKSSTDPLSSGTG